MPTTDAEVRSVRSRTRLNKTNRILGAKIVPVFRCSCAKRTSVSWRRLAAWRNRLVSKTNEFANSKRNSNCCDAAPPTLTRAPASCNHDVIANLHILWPEQSCEIINLYCARSVWSKPDQCIYVELQSFAFESFVWCRLIFCSYEARRA